MFFFVVVENFNIFYQGVCFLKLLFCFPPCSYFKNFSESFFSFGFEF